MTDDAIRIEVRVEADPETAFSVFTDGLGRWWPLAFTFSGPDFAGAVLDEKGWSEVDGEENERPWGVTRVWEPPARLVVGFGIGPDRQPAPPDQASEVEVRFEALEGATLVVLEHSDFARHGEAADRTREGMASPWGWPTILAEFARELRQRV